MMPIWVFAIFIVLFVAAYIWERIVYKKLELEYEIVGTFLDKYISMYGPLPGILEIGEEPDAGNKK